MITCTMTVKKSRRRLESRRQLRPQASRSWPNIASCLRCFAVKSSNDACIGSNSGGAARGKPLVALASPVRVLPAAVAKRGLLD